MHERTFVCSRIEMTGGDSSHSPSDTAGRLNKRRHSSSMPLRCANQSYSYYERDEDLDLDPQELTLAAQECFLKN